MERFSPTPLLAAGLHAGLPTSPCATTAQPSAAAAHGAQDRADRRRPLARRAFLAASVAALAGCRIGADGFHGVDITGADYAKSFQLRDGDGRTRTLAEFKGRAVLVFFGFTQCPDVCPTALVRAARTKELLGPLGAQLQVIFVTVDPERDTPEVLKAYTTAFDPGFLGLYGSPEETAALAKDFKVYYKKVPTGSSYTMDHSALSYVYDRAGQLRLALRHDQTAEQYAQDLRRLLG